jgi:hypothetical protein
MRRLDPDLDEAYFLGCWILVVVVVWFGLAVLYYVFGALKRQLV